MNTRTIIEQLEDMVDSLAEIKREMCKRCKYYGDCCAYGARDDCPMEDL